MNVWVLVCAAVTGWLLTPPVRTRWHKPTVSWRWRRRRRIDAGRLIVEVAARLRAGDSVDAAYSRTMERAGVSRAEVATDVPEIEVALAVSDRLGAPLADVIDRVAAGIAEAQAAHGMRRLALVGPVATARLLAGLPLVGIIMGSAMGAHPLAVMTDGGFGSLSGLAGIGIGAVGVAWMRRLIAAARKELP